MRDRPSREESEATLQQRVRSVYTYGIVLVEMDDKVRAEVSLRGKKVRLPYNSRCSFSRHMWDRSAVMDEEVRADVSPVNWMAVGRRKGREMAATCNTCGRVWSIPAYDPSEDPATQTAAITEAVAAGCFVM